MRKLLLTASIVATGALAACTSTSTTPQPINLTFADVQALPLRVGAVQINDKSTASSLRNASELQLRPAVALSQYATNRFKAGGGEGVLTITINQAALSTNAAQKTGDWRELLDLGEPQEYTITMRVGADLTGRTTHPNIRSAYALERKLTLPASASLAERDRELNELLKGMVISMGAAIEQGIRENMKGL
jgi:hypothetical protein